jgi:hypothetical protein
MECYRDSNRGTLQPKPSAIHRAYPNSAPKTNPTTTTIAITATTTTATVAANPTTLKTNKTYLSHRRDILSKLITDRTIPVGIRHQRGSHARSKKPGLSTWLCLNFV